MHIETTPLSLRRASQSSSTARASLKDQQQQSSSHHFHRVPSGTTDEHIALQAARNSLQSAYPLPFTRTRHNRSVVATAARDPPFPQLPGLTECTSSCWVWGSTGSYLVSLLQRQLFLTPRSCWGCNYIPHSSAAGWLCNRSNRPLIEGLSVEVWRFPRETSANSIFLEVVY